MPKAEKTPEGEQPLVAGRRAPLHVVGKPRVLHVITRLIRGGADENTLLTVNGLANRGYECLLAYGGESEEAQLRLLDRVPGVEVPHLVRAINSWHDLLALNNLRSLMRSFRPHILHTHTAKAGVLGRVAAAVAGVPVVIHGLHGTTFHDGMRRTESATVRFVERTLARGTTAYMSVSSELCDLYVDSHIGRPEQYVVVRSGMDLKSFKQVAGWDAGKIRGKRVELGLSPGVPLAVMVCRLEQRKRVDRLIRAAARLKTEGFDACFAIAGEGPEREGLEELTRQLGVADRVRFLGFRNDVAEVLGCSSVVCLTSAWEGLPRVLVQAVVVGRMVVCYDVNGAHEVIRDGVNGHIVAPDDVVTFSARLAETLTPLPRPVSATTVGQDPIERWDADNMVADTARVYDCLLKYRCLTEELRESMTDQPATPLPALVQKAAEG